MAKIVPLRIRRRAPVALGALLLATLLFGSIVAPGCATVSSNLPKVITAVSDGMLVLDTIETFINGYFASHPNPAEQVKVNNAIAHTKASLDAALRIASGAENLDQAKVDEAFVEFRTAYTDLMGIVAAYGVQPDQGGKLRAAPGGQGLTVPAPLAMDL